MPTNETLHNWREGRYIKSWLHNKGIIYLRRNQANINKIIDEYESELTINTPVSFSSAERYKLVSEVIDYELNVRPDYYKLLKRCGLTDAKMAYLLGYKNSNSWNKSYKRYKIINTILTTHELSNKNPAFNPIK